MGMTDSNTSYSHPYPSLDKPLTPQERGFNMQVKDNIFQFITAGKCLFTVVNTQTSERFTFKVKRADNEDDKSPWFVMLLNGPDNYYNYKYLGCIFKNSEEYKYVITRKSKVSKEAPSQRFFTALFDNLTSGPLPESMHIYHEGKCGRCGKRLTVPESIETGLGPICSNMMGL